MPEKIEERIGVRASQERIWEVLSNLEGWKDWNPLNPRVEGRLAIGAALAVEQRLPGQAAETLQVRVIDWVPLEQIHLRNTLARGWAWSVRYLEIEPLGPQNCIFSCGELFGGLLGGHVAKRRRKALRAGFRLMAEALREEAEKGAAPAAKAPAASKAKQAGKPKAAAKTAPPARKKTALKPVVLKTYAPEPLGMKKPGAKKL